MKSLMAAVAFVLSEATLTVEVPVVAAVTLRPVEASVSVLPWLVCVAPPLTENCASWPVTRVEPPPRPIALSRPLESETDSPRSPVVLFVSVKRSVVTS